MKVLFAVDIRTDASQVVARALPWITRLGATVDLVFVDHYRAMLELYTPPAFRSELDRVVHEAQERLGALLGEIPVGHRGRAIVDLTSIDEMIETRSPDYAMVMVGTQGRVGLAHLWAGSVAERIVRFSKSSVLVLRDGPPHDSLRMLFAVDPTQDPAALASALGALAERMGARVDLLAVQELPTLAATLEAPSLYVLLAQQAEEERAALVGRLQQLLESRFPAAVRGSVQVETGTPTSGILQHISEADLVVVGTHGRTGVAHAVLGSVAERVVRRSDRSVLVLRA